MVPAPVSYPPVEAEQPEAWENDAQQWWQEEHGDAASHESENEQENEETHGACRDMFRGALKLIGRFIPRALDTLPLNDTEQKDEPMVIAVGKPLKADEKQVAGTLPHRAVQISRSSMCSDLHLGFSWIGGAKLMPICLQLKGAGRHGPRGDEGSFLQKTIWNGSKGGLSSPGIELADLSNLPFCEDSAAFSLRLASIPADVFACAFALVAKEEVASSDGFLQVRSAQLRLAPSPMKPHGWRYNQEKPGEMANTWVCAILYRGPHGSWRLEPMSMKLMLVAFNEASGTSAMAAAVEDAARSITWKLRWILKDRCWGTASEERHLGQKPHA